MSIQSTIGHALVIAKYLGSSLAFEPGPHLLIQPTHRWHNEAQLFNRILQEAGLPTTLSLPLTPEPTNADEAVPGYRDVGFPPRDPQPSDFPPPSGTKGTTP